MLKIIKKNQLTILVLSLMLVTAGYLNYNETVEVAGTEIADIGDATLVSSNISNATINETNQSEANNTENNNVNEIASSVSTTQETIQTNAQVDESNEYFTTSRLERETMYSQMLESYQKILDSSTTSEKQKNAAQEEIDKINKTKNAIMISENLIKTKGIEDLIIFQNDDSVSVVIKNEQLNKENIAQIQSIIAREMGADIEDIHIMNK